MTYVPRDHLTPDELATLDRIPPDEQAALIDAINAWFDAEPAPNSADPIVAQFCDAVGIDGTDIEVAHGVRSVLFQFRDTRQFEPLRLLCVLAAGFARANVS